MKKSKFKYPLVMLIEDNDIDVFIHEKVMESIDFAEKIFVHGAGISALEFLHNLSKENKNRSKLIPSLIFLNINLPIMDGLQFIEEFEKLNNRVSSFSKIVVVTNSINPAERERALKSKCVLTFIHKPLTEEHLKKVHSLYKKSR